MPFQAGSATDLISRQLGAALSTELGQPFVVEARPGAAAAIGSTVRSASAPAMRLRTSMSWATWITWKGVASEYTR